MAENKFVIEFVTESHYTAKELESFKNEMISWISEGDDEIVGDSFQMKFGPLGSNITEDSNEENKEVAFENLSEGEQIEIVKTFLKGKKFEALIHLEEEDGDEVSVIKLIDGSVL